MPAAVSGIMAALILGISRAIGETMVVAIAAGGTGGSALTLDPLDRGPDDDRRHHGARHGLGSGPGVRVRVRQPLLRRVLLFLITLA